MKRAFAVLMITLGSFLEIYFYIYRFIQDGMPIYISVIIAAALNLLLALSVLRAKDGPWWLAIAIPIAIYSVFSTSAGQTFSLLNREAASVSTVSVASNDKLVERYGKDLDSLLAEREAIVARLVKVDTVEKRFEYRITVGNDEKRMTEIDAEKTRIQALMASATQERNVAAVQGVRATSIYSFYSGIAGWGGTDCLKFIFHTVLSVFIALMTPVGLLSWPRSAELIDRESQSTLNIQSAPLSDAPDMTVHSVSISALAPIISRTSTANVFRSISADDISRFVNLSWYRVRQKTSDMLLPEPTFFDFMKRQSVQFSPDVYKRLSELCIELNIFDIHGKILITDETQAISILTGECHG